MTHALPADQQAPGPALVPTAGELPAPAADTGTPPPNPGAQPDQQRSPIGSLRARRQQIAEELYTDIRVPRWGEDDEDDPGRMTLYVRCRTVSAGELDEVMTKRRKHRGKSSDWIDLANADLLVRACMGVWAYAGGPADPDTKHDPRAKYSLRDGEWDGTWTKFDPDLADALGMDNPDQCGAVAVVRALVPTSGDLVQMSNELMAFSGLSSRQADQDFTSG